MKSNIARILVFLFGLPLVAATSSDLGYAVLVDSLDRQVKVSLPVQSIVSLNSGISEVIAAMDAGDLMIGRDSFSTFPNSLADVRVVAKNSAHVNMEQIAALQPNLLLADPMFDTDKIDLLERMGVAVYIHSTSNADNLPDLIKDLGQVLQKSQRASDILILVENALDRIRDSISALNIAEKNRVNVYFESRKANMSISGKVGLNDFIQMAGGHNIAVDEKVRFPMLSNEYIVLANPDVIIRRVSGDISMDAMQSIQREIMERPAIKAVKAVYNSRVHVIKSDILISLRYPAGIMYLSKIFYPQSRLNPVRFYENYVQELFGVTSTQEPYVFP